MRLEQLSFLVTIARVHSISRAAETLYISQPALSAAIKSLETELGKTLFKRTNRGIFLTAEGERIHDEAVALLHVISGWYEKKHVNKQEGEVHLACTPIISCYLTPNIVVPFQKLHPKITVFVHSSQQYEVIARLKGTRSSIAVTTLAEHSRLLEEVTALGWESVHLFTDERRIYIGAEHPLAKKATLTPEDLKQLRLAYYSDSRDQISQRYAPYFAPGFRLANKEDILELVIRNQAVFIQPCHLFRHDYRVVEKLVVERRIPLPEVDTRAAIFALHGPELSSIEQLFWDYLLVRFSCNL